MLPILPPVITRPTGKPPKNKRKEPDSPSKGPKLSKKNQFGNCNKCGKPGHNMRTCKGEVGGNKTNVNVLLCFML